MKNSKLRIMCFLLACLIMTACLSKTSVLAYDSTKAQKYAEKWWNGYNNEYPMYAKDCTNYVSQALEAGGLKQDSTWNWYYDTFNTDSTPAWCNADELRKYLVKSGRGYVKKYWDTNPDTSRENPPDSTTGANSLFIANVVFYDWQSDGDFDHAAIITSYQTSTGNKSDSVCAHSESRYRQRWHLRDHMSAYTYARTTWVGLGIK